MRQLCTWPRLQAHGRAATADLGASVITGIDGNPLAVLAKQLQIPLHDINTANVPLYLAGGEEAAAELDAEVRLQNATILDANMLLQCHLMLWRPEAIV